MARLFGEIDVAHDGDVPPQVIVHSTGRVSLDVDGEVRLKFWSLAAYDAWQEAVDRSRAALGQPSPVNAVAYQARVRALREEKRRLTEAW